MSKSLLSLDVASVFVFVIAGRSNHGAEESVAGIFHTAGPFLIALVLGWIIMRAWQAPASLPVGAGVLATTVVAGMLVRRLVFDDGTQLSFVLVAAAFLSLFLLGWRAGAALAGRAQSVGT